MKEKVEVAVVQMLIAWQNPEKNLEIMLAFLEKICHEKKVDLVIFPELANTGYVKGRDREFGKGYINKAEKIPGPFTDALCASARKYGLYVISGLCEAHPQIPATLYNSAVLIGPQGNIIGVHHKLHIPGEEKHYFHPGSTTDVYKTDLGNIGMLICYDATFPEIPRILSLKGAEIVCAVFNGPKWLPYDRFDHLASTRASENRNYFILCNRVGEEDVQFSGRSTIAAPDGQIVSRSTTEEEDIVYAVLHNDKILEERAFLPIFIDRRPELYEAILKRF
ncbi:MAG: hypothetical protein A2156_01420 [Deltaproteobacteria bacterium RBG_16_48_10]|nr:MAG: hypothetical protein A2156_01420 [Deltaproteobacteria bacterium RBG_16_48_10]